tara:strand:+ start:23805 stop:24782 length:978 start_codon:yes stop_codon:yes gene_type:complete
MSVNSSARVKSTDSGKTIAVIIPAFNSASFIRETLDAILAQSCPPTEVIVVDDGSTDNTAEVVQSYGGIVRCLSVANGGQGKARRLAIAQTHAEWIALCDSDDIWNPDHLERRWQLIERYPAADLTFSDLYSFGPNADPAHSLLQEAPAQWLERWAVKDASDFYTLTNPYLAVLQFNPSYPSGVVFRRESYQRMGGFKDKYSRWIGEDSEFIRRFSSLENCLFVGDSQQTWGYRRHPNNYSLIQWRNINAKAIILDELLAEHVVPPAFIADTQAESDWMRCRAFDQACWEREREGLGLLYAQLPAGQRNIKRSAKYILSRVGVFV